MFGNTFNPSGSGGDLTLIQSITLAAPTALIDFQNIPTGFSSLTIRGSLRTTRAGGAAATHIRFNGDVGNNYYALLTSLGAPALLVTGEILAGFPGFAGGANAAGGMAAAFSSFTIDIPDYLSTTRKKSWISTAYVSSTGIANAAKVFFVGGLWQSLNAINRVTLFDNGFNLDAGSTAQLYGMT